ncbi:hypothetical protein BX600DRAFT_473400 [Xylariales sp. PMI_506]|nr:hypothetical protein BX600DRAFT_473400 [Xylariales sp. PMI_506]
MEALPDLTIHTLFVRESNTWQYIVADSRTREALLIDCALDFTRLQHTIDTDTADRILNIASCNSYQIVGILETHGQPLQRSATGYLKSILASRKERLPCICVGSSVYQHVDSDSHQIDFDGSTLRYLNDGQCIQLGSLEIKVVHFGGNIPNHVGYIIGSNIFSGMSMDSLKANALEHELPENDNLNYVFSKERTFSISPEFRLYFGRYNSISEEGIEPQAYTTVAEFLGRAS